MVYGQGFFIFTTVNAGVSIPDQDILLAVRHFAAVNTSYNFYQHQNSRRAEYFLHSANDSIRVLHHPHLFGGDRLWLSERFGTGFREPPSLYAW